MNLDLNGKKLLDFYCLHQDSGHLIIGGLVKPHYYYIVYNTLLYNLLLFLIKKIEDVVSVKLNGEHLWILKMTQYNLLYFYHWAEL